MSIKTQKAAKAITENMFNKCKWDVLRDGYRISCNGKWLSSLMDYKFCPYCGREIDL